MVEIEILRGLKFQSRRLQFISYYDHLVYPVRGTLQLGIGAASPLNPE